MNIEISANMAILANICAESIALILQLKSFYCLGVFRLEIGTEKLSITRGLSGSIVLSLHDVKFLFIGFQGRGRKSEKDSNGFSS